jgi:hypothetical protein
MKKFLWLAVGLLLLSNAVVFAAVRLEDDGASRGSAVEKINIKGGTVTKTGMTGVVDLTSLTGINWASVTGITGDAINWTNVQLEQVGVTGVNWTNQSLVGGVNWTAISNNAAASNITCWKSNGQLGKCGTSVSGVNCTACN